MGKVFAVEYLTLDGVMDEPGWSMPYFNDELFKFQYDNLFGCDALLLGRITYEGFAEVWPARTDDIGFSARMNDIPKYVASTTLTQATWNATLLQGDVPAAVAKLKESGQTLMLEGSAQLLESLRKHDLIDEYRLMIHPVVLGRGKKLFADGNHESALTLADTMTTSTGVAVLTYRPERKKAAGPATT
jgi:dihydrofolate reductase